MIWHLLKKDLLRLVKQPWGFLLLSAVPIVLALLMSLVFQAMDSSDMVLEIDLVIEDHDDTFISEFIPSAFQRGELADLFNVQEVDSGAVEWVEEDRVSAALIIPKGFSDSLLYEKPTTLTLIKNPSQAFGPKIVQETVSILAEGGDRLLRMGAEPIRLIREQMEADSSFSNQQVSAIAVLINQMLNKSGSLLFEPPITLQTRDVLSPSSSSSSNTSFAISLAGIVCMCALFVANGLAVDFFREQDGFTLYRIMVAPAGRVLFFMAKFLYLSAAAFASFVAVWILGFTLWQIPLPLAQVLPFVLFSILFIVAATAVVVFMYSFLKTRGQASAATPAIIIVLSILGGGMVPLHALPGFLQRMAFISPVYWGADGIQQLIVSQRSLADISLHILVLLLITIVFTFTAIWVQRRRMI